MGRKTYSQSAYYFRTFPGREKAMDDLVGFVVETNSRLMFLVEESAEDSVLSDVAEGGKVKSKDIQERWMKS